MKTKKFLALVLALSVVLTALGGLTVFADDPVPGASPETAPTTNSIVRLWVRNKEGVRYPIKVVGSFTCATARLNVWYPQTDQSDLWELRPQKVGDNVRYQIVNVRSGYHMYVYWYDPVIRQHQTDNDRAYWTFVKQVNDQGDVITENGNHVYKIKICDTYYYGNDDYYIGAVPYPNGVPSIYTEDGATEANATLEIEVEVISGIEPDCNDETHKAMRGLEVPETAKSGCQFTLPTTVTVGEDSKELNWEADNDGVIIDDDTCTVTVPEVDDLTAVTFTAKAADGSGSARYQTIIFPPSELLGDNAVTINSTTYQLNPDPVLKLNNLTLRGGKKLTDAVNEPSTWAYYEGTDTEPGYYYLTYGMNSNHDILTNFKVDRDTNYVIFFTYANLDRSSDVGGVIVDDDNSERIVKTPSSGVWNRVVQAFNSGDHDNLNFMVWFLNAQSTFPDNYSKIQDLRIYEVNGVDVEAPPLVSALGWDGTDFTIDFFLDFDPVKGDDGYSETFTNMLKEGEFTLNVYREDSDAAIIEQSLNMNENHGVRITPANTNAIYSAEMLVKLGEENYASDEMPSESVYSLVMSAIYTGEFSEAAIDQAQLAKVNKVLKNGGLYLNKVYTPEQEDPNGEATPAKTEWRLTPEAALVMDAKTETDTTSGTTTVTVTLNEKAQKAGLKFSTVTSYTDSEGTGEDKENVTVGTVVTANDDGTTVTITIPADAKVQDVDVLSLESVSLEFVPTEVAGAEAENAGTELDFVPEL